MILKDFSDSTPIWIRYSMISSRVQIAVEMVATPLMIRSCALPSHTLVPWDRPEIRTRSENALGFASITICIAKSVPNSGMPNAPNFVPPICSGVMPNASVFWNRLITSCPSSGIVRGSLPVRSCSIRIMVGSSCPRISSFNRL